MTGPVHVQGLENQGKSRCSYREEFGVVVGFYQGSVPSPLLFIIVGWLVD